MRRTHLTSHLPALAGFLTGIAGAGHLASAFGHAEVAPAEGLLLGQIGAVQLVLAVLLTMAPAATAVRIAAVVTNAAAAGVWTLSRTAGAPWFGTEPVGAADVVVTGVEVAVVLILVPGSVHVARDWWGSVRRDRATSPAFVRSLSALVVVMAASFASVASGTVPQHDHGAHGDSAGAHSHGGTRGDSHPGDTHHVDPDALVARIDAGELSYKEALAQLGRHGAAPVEDPGPDPARPPGAPIDGDSFRAGEEPEDVISAFGSVWVVNRVSGTVSRLDPETGDLAATIPVGTHPSRIAAGAGALWVTNFGDNTVSRIDPATNTTVGSAVSVGRRPVGVAANGTTVVVTNSADGTLSVLDAGSGAVTATSDRLGYGLLAVDLDRDTVWVAASLDRAVQQVALASLTPVGDPVPVPAGAVDIEVDGGVVWVVGTSAGTVSSIHPGHGDVHSVVVDDITAPGQGPTGLAVVGDTVWVVNNHDRTLIGVDRATGTAGAPRFFSSTVGRGRGARVAVTADHVWVTDRDAGSVVRFSR